MTHALRLCPLALALPVVLGAGCRGAAPPPGGPDAVEEHPSDLVACLYFYRHHNIGQATLATGLQRRTPEGWESLTWGELITSAVDVDPTGRWIYLAAGDGVHVSEDGGRTFRVTGGIDVAEVQGVCIDARDPSAGWAATAYGVLRADDVRAARPWRKLDHGAKFGFTSDVVQDAGDSRRLWVASERGVFVSDDEGRSFTRASTDVRVSRITQDAHDPRHLWAGSDGLGVLESVDGGHTWRPTGAPTPTVLCIEQDPHLPHTLYCGSRGRVHRSDDDGRTWVARTSGIEEDFHVFDIEADPEVPGRLLLAGSDGVRESTDGARTWHGEDFRGALVPDLSFVHLADVPARGQSADPGTLRFAEPDRVFPEHRPPAGPAFTGRRDRLREALLAASPAPSTGALSFTAAWLELQRGHGGAETWRRLEAYLAEPTSSLFWAFDAIAFYLHHRSELPPPLADRFHELLTTQPVYRGDTENHWVKHYATLLLAAQTFPDTPAAQWYMGRSTQSLYDEARDWLFHWAHLTATRGQGEFDSPHYIFVYVRPLLLLYDFAAEPAVKQLAGMMLDLLLADYLSVSLDGAYGGGHSRELRPRETTDAGVVGLHDLYAGGIPPVEKPTSWMLLPVQSSYVPPALLTAMANEREGAWVQTEVKRVRNVIRFGDERNPPVYEYAYLTDTHIMGSLQGGILQPIQQHTWDVTWRSSSPGATLFAVHPFVSGYELAMFFPEDLHVLVDNVTAQKGIYGSPDKLMSSSPYEQVFQSENVLLALYQVPPGERFPHVDLHVPRFLERAAEGGWWFGREGDFRVAWFATAEGEWSEFEGGDRFRCPAARAGFVVVTGPRGDEGAAPFDEFRARILASPVPTLEGEGEGMTLRYTSPKARVLAKRWGDAWGTIDGAPAPFPTTALFAGPFLEARVDEGIITLRGGGRERVLDFRDFSIRIAD